ncbi:MAG: thiol:disulfide interchange protein DsbA/DsbL [Gammaproteobacteria bacterium]
MLRRMIVGLLALLVPALVMAASGGPDKHYDAGIDYQLIDPPQPAATAGKIQVIELFWYGCPHCFHFEPHLDQWLAHKPKGVVFERIPAVLGPNWTPLARAFYTEKLLGVFDKTHLALFNAIHKDHEFKLLSDPQAMADFFAKHGVPKAKFLSTYNSFAVDVDVNRAKDMTRRYGINGVPSMIVAGKYRTSGQLAGSNDAMLNVVDYLVRKERASADAGAAR